MAKDVRPQVNIRADADAIRDWIEAATLDGISLSAWLRQLANRAARKALAK